MPHYGENSVVEYPRFSIEGKAYRSEQTAFKLDQGTVFSECWWFHATVEGYSIVGYFTISWSEYSPFQKMERHVNVDSAALDVEPDWIRRPGVIDLESALQYSGAFEWARAALGTFARLALLKSGAISA